MTTDSLQDANRHGGIIALLDCEDLNSLQVGLDALMAAGIFDQSTTLIFRGHPTEGNAQVPPNLNGRLSELSALHSASDGVWVYALGLSPDWLKCLAAQGLEAKLIDASACRVLMSQARKLWCF